MYSEKRYYGERLKGVFLMDKPGWKKKVVRRGLTVLLQVQLIINN
jgi:hypothetical protein